MKHSGVATALNMIYGHMDFLERNTGVTNDPTVDKFVLNPEWVLSNNRHFIAKTHQEYQPNGDATTEGQSLLITAFVYAYLATGDEQFKVAAEKSFDAYVDFFYAGDPIPDAPDRWIANWLVNGKEPCLAHYPRNLADPTYGGFKCVPLTFVNGQAQVPHGAPFWGEYLDVASFAHRGMLAWNAINATPKPTVTPINFDLALTNRVTTTPVDSSQLAEQYKTVNWAAMGGDPVIDWSGDSLPEYPVKSIIAWSGEKIEDGDMVEDGIASSEHGKVQLWDTSINGVYFLNFAVRLPVALEGTCSPATRCGTTAPCMPRWSVRPSFEVTLPTARCGSLMHATPCGRRLETVTPAAGTTRHGRRASTRHLSMWRSTGRTSFSARASTPARHSQTGSATTSATHPACPRCMAGMRTGTSRSKSPRR